MPYSNPIVGGTALIRRAINSPNFVTTVAGWSINADGTAEFDQAIIRGEIDVGNPPTSGYVITANIPAILQAHYAGQLQSFSEFCVLMYNGDGSYYYQISGIRPFLLEPTMFAGIVDKFGNVREYQRLTLGPLSPSVQQWTFTDAQAANLGYVWVYGTDLGAARTQNNTLAVYGTDVTYGGANDTGSVNYLVDQRWDSLSLSRGILDAVNVTTTGALTAAASAETDIPNLALSATLTAGRTYLITAVADLAGTVAGDIWELNARLTTAVTGTKIGESNGIGGSTLTAVIQLEYTPAASGAATIHISFLRRTGTGTFQAFGSPGAGVARSLAWIADAGASTSWRSS